MEKMRLRPEERLYQEYPWQVFAGGWIAIAKAFAWLFSELAVPGLAGRLILAHYALFMPLFIACGIAIWNFKRWGQIGAIVLSAAGLVLFFFFNYYSLLGLEGEALLTKIFMLISGPVGDVALIFVLLPVSRLFTRKPEEGTEGAKA